MTPSTTTPSTDDNGYPPLEEAEVIVREIIAVMTLRLLDAGKVFSSGALDEWRVGLLKQVTQQLRHGNWENDRHTVLAVAADMASIAVVLAYKGDVDKDRVDAAFQAIRFHRRCPPRPPGGAKTFGCWCDCP
jgi:hypothetical protein